MKQGGPDMLSPTKQMVAGMVAALLVCGPAWAQVSMKGDVHISFGADEQRAIKDYYGREIIEKARERSERDDGPGKGKGHGKGRQGKGLPPGLAKQNKLPPGIAKQLERGAILPSDLQREMRPLPRELEIRLKPLSSPNQVRVTVGTDILIMDKETRKILDVMRDVALLTHDVTK
jgi:hypothetical protein